MTHPDAVRLDALVDDELAAPEAREIEAHVAGCPECSRSVSERRALRAAIRTRLPALQAPDLLRQRLTSSLRAAAAPSRSSLVPWRALAVAASLLIVAVGSWRIAQQRAEGSLVADQVLQSHVRSLMPGHLTDVVSSDEHTVKPWFNGRVDYSPPVYDFAGRGYPLLGGRLDYVDGRAVADLVYGRRQHVINVMVWPSAGSGASGPTLVERQGYHLLHWVTAENDYWVVSDLGVAELREFADLLRSGDSATVVR